MSIRFRRIAFAVIPVVFALGACVHVRVERSSGDNGIAQTPWVAGPALPRGRDHHIAFITRSRDGQRASLWVAGGNTYRRVLSDSWRLGLRANGSTDSAWVAQPSLPVALAGAGVAVADGIVVVGGGQDSLSHKRADVFVATILPDGGLVAWRSAPPLPAPAFHHSLIAWRHWVYATGGIADRVSTSSVWRAAIGPDGTLGPWTAGTPLARPRSHHAAFVSHDRLCVSGGIDGNPSGEATALSDIQCAPLRDDGSLGEWEVAAQLPTAVATHAVVCDGDRIAVFGGVVNNRDVTDEVWSATIDQSGAFGVWRKRPSLPQARSHVHQVPVWNNRAYSVGGSAGRVVFDALWIGTDWR